MSNRSCLLGAIAALALAATPVRAQQLHSTIRGIVSDGTKPLEQANVEIFGTKLRTVTGADGGFVFDSLKSGPYWLRVRRIGFAPMTFSATVIAGQTKSVEVRLEATPYELPELSVSGGMTSRRYADYYWRSRTAWGKFYTRDDIARIKPFDPIDLALHGLPNRSRFDLEQRSFGSGMTEIGMREQGFGVIQARTMSNWQLGGCAPGISINGSPPWPGTSLSDFQLDDVEAMEVYRTARQAPIEFQGQTAVARCGIVVVWLR